MQILSMGLNMSRDPTLRLISAQSIMCVMTTLSKSMTKKKQIEHLNQCEIAPRVVNVLKKVLSKSKVNLIDLSRDVLLVSCRDHLEAFKCGIKSITLCHDSSSYRKKRTQTRCDLFLNDTTMFLRLPQHNDFEERWIEIEFLKSENCLKFDSSALKISVRSFISTRALNDLQSLTMTILDRKIFEKVFAKSGGIPFDFAKCSSVSMPICTGST